MHRYVGIDYGHKRIGLAIGDTEMRIAMPLKQVDGCGDVELDAKAVLAAVADELIDVFVVGLPGEAGPDGVVSGEEWEMESQRTEDGGRRTEVRSQGSGVRGQEAGVRSQGSGDDRVRTADGGRRTEDREERTEDRGQRTEDGGRQTPVEDTLGVEKPDVIPEQIGGSAETVIYRSTLDSTAVSRQRSAVPAQPPAVLRLPSSEQRVTYLYDGATVHDWLPADSLHPAGRLVLVSSETRRRERVYVVDAARRPTVSHTPRLTSACLA